MAQTLSPTSSALLLPEIPIPAPTARRFSQGSKLGNHRANLMISYASGITVLRCLKPSISKCSVSYVLSYFCFVLFSGRKRVNSVSSLFLKLGPVNRMVFYHWVYASVFPLDSELLKGGVCALFIFISLQMPGTQYRCNND